MRLIDVTETSGRPIIYFNRLQNLPSVKTMQHGVQGFLVYDTRISLQGIFFKEIKDKMLTKAKCYR